MFVVTLTVSLSAALVRGLGELRRVTTLERARQQLCLALRQAASIAYLRAVTVELRVLADGTQLSIRSGDAPPSRIDLPAAVRLIGAPRRGGLRFFASGLADNATFILALTDGDKTSRVVVNQRGLIR